MNRENEPKFELTWIQREGRRQPSLHFEASESEGVGATHYAVALRVCGEPRCDCYAVLFYCRPIMPDHSLAPPDLSREFWLDVWDRSVAMTPELKADPQTKDLAEIARAGLSDTAWEELYRWFRVAKLETIQTTDVAKIETTDLPNANGGRMIGFVDVFPRGLALDFSFANQLWAADEQYCVQPKCDCKETILSFLQYQDAAGRRLVQLPKLPSLRYNYRSQAVSAVRPGPAGTPDPSQLLAAVKAAHSSLNQQLELRHLIMQSLYARLYMAEIAAGLDSRLDTTTIAVTHNPATKVGRNDPCPCGSGRKFKKCCAR